MNIAIGKINSKIYFDRTNENVIRNSSNGHKSAYAIYNIMNQLGLNINFISIGQTDLNDTKKLNCDFGFFITGIIDETQSDDIINYINNMNKPYILYCEDPRCLEVINKNKILNKTPLMILSQFNGMYTFHDVPYEIFNINQEFSEFKLKEIDLTKQYETKNKKAINILCNMNSDDNSNRQLTLIKYGEYFINKNIEFNVYGKTNEYLLKNYSNIFKGSLTCAEAEKKLNESIISLCVPIKENWSTSKYIECINNCCIPTFTNDYLTPHYLDKFKVESPEQLYELFEYYIKSENNYCDELNKIISTSRKMFDEFKEKLKFILMYAMKIGEKNESKTI